jgi:hypothetical protein
MSSEKATRRVGMASPDPEGVAHHARARHLAERADMRQARGAIPCLEESLLLARAFEPLDQLACLLERPGIGGLGGFDEGRIDRQGLRHGTRLIE